MKYLILSLLLASCTPTIVFDDATHFTILKNKNYPSRSPVRLFNFKEGDIIIITFTFDESCWYDEDDAPNNLSWNKLIGLKDQLFSPHKNSWRIAWRSQFGNRNAIELAHYYYINNERHIKEIPLSFITDYTYELYGEITKDGLLIDDTLIPIQLTQGQWFQSNPYFGGERGAPWKITLKVNIEKHG